MDYVLVTILSDSCIHCPTLAAMWNDVTRELLKVLPTLRFPIATVDTKNYKYPPIMVKNGKINVNLYPKDLQKYLSLWTPITLLIPTASWDKCCKNLGRNNNAVLEGVHIMNSMIKNNEIKPLIAWNTLDPKEYGMWLKNILDNTKKEPTHNTTTNICNNIVNNLISR